SARGACGSLRRHHSDDQYHHERGGSGVHVPGRASDGKCAWRELSAVRRHPDGGGLVRVHQSGRVSNEPDGAKARRVPGGYSFMDFAKVGTPLTIIVGIVVLALAPIVYGF